MKLILVIAVILLVVVAIYSQGLMRSLAELSAFLTVIYFLFRKNQPA